MTTRVGALLIHGLGGTQYDLGGLHRILKKAGVETHGLNLPGHGGQPEDLVPMHVEHWLDALEQQYREMQPKYDQLHVVGKCMGALLALLLCLRVQHDAQRGKLVLLASPVYIDGWSIPWYAGLRYPCYLIPGLQSRIKVDEGEPYGIKNALIRAVVKTKFERGDDFHYRWIPLACVRQVDRMRKMVIDHASEIRTPTLIMHAREDELTSLRSAEFLQAAIPEATSVVLENSYHMICVDNDRDIVANRMLEFFGYEARTPRGQR